MHPLVFQAISTILQKSGFMVHTCIKRNILPIKLIMHRLHLTLYDYPPRHLKPHGFQNKNSYLCGLDSKVEELNLMPSWFFVFSVLSIPLGHPKVVISGTGSSEKGMLTVPLFSREV